MSDSGAWFQGWWVVNRGSSKSGNWGHKGVKGRRGGSAPRSTGAVYQVGITSYRDGKELAMVRAQMEQFEGDLKASAKDVQVQEGTGGWEGGSEPTWITSFTDGPAALSQVAETAKKYDQDAALIMKQSTEGAPGASPKVNVGFDQSLSKEQMQEVEATMVTAGLGGWTWGQKGGKTTVMAACIPAWGGEPKAHLDAMDTVMAVCQDTMGKVTSSIDWAEMTVMERDDYDRFII